MRRAVQKLLSYLLPAVTLMTLVVPAASNAPIAEATASLPACGSDTTSVTSYYYLINGVKYYDLTGNVTPGASVQVNFTVRSTCANASLSIVSYTAPGATFDANTASQQHVYESANGTFTGNGTLGPIDVPNCYYQVDFVAGSVINQLGPASSNNFYSPQGRLFDADNG